MSHTPGPWYVGRYGENDSDVCAESGPLICAVRGGAAEPGDTAADADAHLISAAPDLLAAARLANQELIDMGQGSSGSPALVALWAAIAKAEGRE